MNNFKDNFFLDVPLVKHGEWLRASKKLFSKL